MRRLTVREVIERQYKRPVLQVFYGKDEETWYDRYRHYCPACLRSLTAKREINFCPSCGQRLDWEHFVTDVKTVREGRKYKRIKGSYHKDTSEWSEKIKQEVDEKNEKIRTKSRERAREKAKQKKEQEQE